MIGMINSLEKMSAKQLEYFATYVMDSPIQETRELIQLAKHEKEMFFPLYNGVKAYVEEHYHLFDEQEGLRYKQGILHFKYTCSLERDGDGETYPFQWNVQFKDGERLHETHMFSPSISPEDHPILAFYFQNVNMPLQYSPFVKEHGDKGKGLQHFLDGYWSNPKREYVYKSSESSIFNRYMVRLYVKGLEDVELLVCYDLRTQSVRWINCLSLGFMHLTEVFDQKELTHFIAEEAPCRLALVFKETMIE